MTAQFDNPTRRCFMRSMLLLSAAAALPGAARGQAVNPPMKIGIIGSGRIGSTVGSLWVKAGHEVMFSSRHPEELKPLVGKLGPRARAGQVADAAAFGDAVFLAVPFGAYPQIGRDFGGALAGKVMLDAGNAFEGRDGPIAREARELGIGLTSAKYFPGVRIVRAFNTLGYTVLQNNAHRAGGLMAIPIAGDDEAAIAVASRLIRDAGFDPVLIGSLARASLFASGAPLYGQQITADEMRRRASELK